MDLEGLHKEGWVLAPGEIPEELLFRKQLSEEGEHLPDPSLEKASDLTEKIYGFRVKKAPIFYSNKSLWPWQGAILWSYSTEDGNAYPRIQVRKGDTRLFSFFYDQSEILAHELVHMVRFAFKEPLFEEILAYKTSKSAFRRFLGPLFIYPIESVVFMFMNSLSSIAFIWLESVYCFFPFIAYFLYLLGRLCYLHTLFNLAVKRAKKEGVKEPILGYMLGLSDQKIMEMAKGK